MNQKGAGLLGLLIVVAIIGLLTYGGSYFWTKKPTAEQQEKINQIENKVDEINNQIDSSISGLHQIKQQAQEDIEEINDKTASSVEAYLE